MGSFYTNLTLRTTDRDAVRKRLEKAGRRAFISPSAGGALVVFDEACEGQDPEEQDLLASPLCDALRCVGLSVVLHDDDMLWYGLYDRHKLVDEYSSAPEYFDGGAAPPTGGDVALLCKAFGRPDIAAKLAGILSRTREDPEAYAVESERHADLVEALSLPATAVSTGFAYLEEGEVPDGLAIGDFIRVG